MHESEITVIVQARMNSTRFPGKVLEKINGLSVLECLFDQLKYSKLLINKIIATTNNKEDDEIEKFGQLKGIQVFRGNDLDVLDRYYQCAKKNNLQNIVRITSDCPLIDPFIVDNVIEKYESNHYDYVNNFSKTRCPSGFEVEVFSFECLEKVWKNAKDDEREHVTKNIYQNPNQFKIGSVIDKRSYFDLHLSVDTKNDLELIKIIYQKIDSKPISLHQILKIISSDSSILQINGSKI